jgi:RNA polymerase sigma-70 factor (ECF subfamily)
MGAICDTVCITVEAIVGQTEQDSIEFFLRSPTEESFCNLFRSLAPRLVCFFRSRGCELSLAEDLTQDVMLSVYRQSSTLRNKDLFRPWLFRIARNALLQHVRSRSRQVETIEMDTRSHEPGGAAEDPLNSSHFAEWMASLRPDERQLMMLRYVEGLEYHEIASMIDMPIGTVQWKVFHSKKKLVERFGKRPV